MWNCQKRNLNFLARKLKLFFLQTLGQKFFVPKWSKFFPFHVRFAWNRIKLNWAQSPPWHTKNLSRNMSSHAAINDKRLFKCQKRKLVVVVLFYSILIEEKFCCRSSVLIFKDYAKYANEIKVCKTEISKIDLKSLLSKQGLRHFHPSHPLKIT